jgi:GNAT superfamily N-acetyltransferase
MPPATDPHGLEVTVGEADREIEDQLIEEVRRFNDEILGAERSRPLAAVARDGKGDIVGGVAGRTAYGWLLIHVVWVRSDSRGTGLGSRLMAMAESEALLRGCAGAQVDTVTFQAPGFYRKLGYKEVGTVDDFPPGYKRHYFAKRLGS